MTREHDLDEFLRRALHAAADSVEPAGDGLERIRHQLARPRLRLQFHLWLTECADLVRLAGIRLEPAASRVWAALLAACAAAVAAVRRLAGWAAAKAGAPAAAEGRSRHGAAHRSQPAGPLSGLGSLSWLRPALAVAGAVVIVVAGVFTLAQLRQTVTDISLLTGGNQSPSAGAPSAPGATRSRIPGGVAPSSPGSSPSARAKGSRHHAAPVPTCTPRATTGPIVTSSPSATPTPSSSPTVTPSPTDTASPGATPSASTAAASTAAPAAGAAPASGGQVRLTSGCYSAGASGSSPAP